MRSAGILMPITSLPSPWGVGTMGGAARSFVDFLVRAGVCVWQVLPIVPTSYGDSPYQSFSTFAGNPYLIDLDDLAAEGLLEPEEYASRPWGDDPTRVDYGALYRERLDVLRLAVHRLARDYAAELERFCASEHSWLEDYALFMALKQSHGGASWGSWEQRLRLSVARCRTEHGQGPAGPCPCAATRLRRPCKEACAQRSRDRKVRGAVIVRWPQSSKKGRSHGLLHQGSPLRRTAPHDRCGGGARRRVRHRPRSARSSHLR